MHAVLLTLILLTGTAGTAAEQSDSGVAAGRSSPRATATASASVTILRAPSARAALQQRMKDSDQSNRIREVAVTLRLVAGGAVLIEYR